MRVMFFMDWPLAITYLQPIFDYLRKVEPDWELFFSTYHEPSRHLAERLGHRIEPPGTAHDLAICCDGYSACPKSNRLVTFHGLASKGAELSSNRAGNYVGTFIAPSEYYRRILIEKMGVAPERVIDGGLSKFDTIGQLPRLGRRPRVLFAPTHNIEISSIPVVQDRIYEIEDVQIHLHMYTRTNDHPDHQKMRSYYPHDDAQEDITAMLVAADIVIADFGSTVLEALALGKMTIQVLNPRWSEFYRRLVEESEMVTLPEVDLPRRFALQARTMDEVLAAVSRYPDFARADFPIVDRIGGYRVSAAIHQWATGA